MKSNIKSFFNGVVVTAIILTSITTIIASQRNQNAVLNFKDIKICIDGEYVESKDANGNPVEPFIIDGTTYLPVRAVASALDKQVEWDSNTYTVNLSEPSKVIADFHHYDFYDSDKYVKASNSENAFDIVLEAIDGDVKDFKIVSISKSNWEDLSNYDYEICDVLYEKDILQQSDYIIASIDTLGYFPCYAMIYTDNKGDLKTYGLMDGDYRGEGLHRLNVDEINLIQ